MSVYGEASHSLLIAVLIKLIIFETPDRHLLDQRQI